MLNKEGKSARMAELLDNDGFVQITPFNVGKYQFGLQATSNEELVRRLSTFDPAQISRRASSFSAIGSGDPTASFRRKNTIVESEPEVFVSQRRQRKSLFIDESAAPADSSWAADVAQSDDEATPPELQLEEHYDENAVGHLGRAANAVAFEDWLGFGLQTTIADREFQAENLRSKQAASESEILHLKSGRLERMLIATGLGEEAIQSIKDGIYNPSTVIPSLTDGFIDGLDEDGYDEAFTISKWDEILKSKDALRGSNHPPSTDDGASIATTVPPLTPHGTKTPLPLDASSITVAPTIRVETPKLSAPPDPNLRAKTPEGRPRVRTRSIAVLEDFFSGVQRKCSTCHDDNAASINRANTTDEMFSFRSGFSQDNDDILSVASDQTAHVGGKVRKRIVDQRREIEMSISETMRRMSAPVSPFSFHDLHESAKMALEVLNEGDPDTEVTLPIMLPGEPPLHGCAEVMRYVQRNVFEKSQELGSVMYAAEWVFRYTIAFLNGQIACDEADALAREEVLAECILALAEMNDFVVVILELGSKAHSYAEFDQLKQWMETQVEDLIVPLEHRLSMILTKCPFPEQRAVLKRYHRKLEGMATNLVNFLVAFDAQWSTTIPYHNTWKDNFLNQCYKRIHNNIATAWMTASLGFIDPVLHLLIKADPKLVHQPKDFRKRISMAAKIEHLVAVEGLSLFQVAIVTKGFASAIVGLQLCMGARYMLDETKSEHDEKWGFSMCDGMGGVNTLEDEDLREEAEKKRQEEEEHQRRQSMIVAAMASAISGNGGGDRRMSRAVGFANSLGGKRLSMQQPHRGREGSGSFSPASASQSPVASQPPDFAPATSQVLDGEKES